MTEKNYCANHIKNLKSHVGEELFFVPTGNNIRRDKTPRKATLLGVGRVKVNFAFEGKSFNHQYRVSDWEELHFDDDYNGGYLVFLSHSELVDYSVRMQLARKFSSAFNGCSDWSKLPLEKLQKINDIIFDGEEVSE